LENNLQDILKSVRARTDLLLSDPEAIALLKLARESSSKKGSFAEVGVYKGGSALLISEVKGLKDLYLFDTFEGIPYVDLSLDAGFKRGQYSESFLKVIDLFKNYKSVFVIPGDFRETMRFVDQKTFSFVHIDVDVFWSALDSIIFFLTHLDQDGIILIHDIGAPGIRKALSFLKGLKMNGIPNTSYGEISLESASG